ncbi:DUF5107 domain-containing protein [Lacihabitans sp. LS3-19]|uniref:DUF5107 domain-containing protein n=1 Tax=Lacihabitans sp. LS3-19 TaxID=2487335 RepID=UPI0020CE2C1C|nr:DUF5107 domain-containing protein [Lacihabitans sp. LS3-19]
MNKVLVFLLLPVLVFAQKKATISEESRPFLTYPFSDPNPNPILTVRTNIYPYHSFEGYSLKGEMQKWKVVKLENDYIIVWVLPEVGGKVWGAIEKSTGKEFIYRNEVMKFRNISMRGPWTSGGIEFNFGFIGHNPSTATPVDYLTKENADGSVSCFVGNTDLTSRTQWRVEIRLPKDKAYFETKALWNNPTPVPQTYYNFMTGAAAVSEDLEFYYPGNQTLDHNGDVHPWPVDEEGHDLSLYKNDNFGSDKSIHTVGEYNDFMGGYFHKSNFGFGHWALYEDMPGRKLWLWSTARDGGIWEDLLTDTDGQYMEFQAGRSFNQYAQSGFRSPIKELPFNPSVTDTWKEIWFPVKEIGGLTEVSPQGVLSIKNENGKLQIGINALAFVQSKITVKSKGKIIFSTDKTFQPMDVFKTSVNIEDGADFEVEATGMDLKHTSKIENILKRPFATTIPLDPESAANFYQIGIEQKENRNYSAAKKILKVCLQKDAMHIDAMAALSELYYRNNLPDSALIYANMALTLDTYHPAANYFAGINYSLKGDYLNALESFGWAARSMEYRSAANAEMAAIRFLQKDYGLTEKYAQSALDYNRFNVNAMKLLVVLYRETGKNILAQQTINQIIELDPLNHFASFEKYNLEKNQANLLAFQNKIKNEFPYQTYLELCLDYKKLGLEKDALEVLNKAPKNSLVSIWKAFLQKNTAALNTCAQESPDFVFPYRTEDVEALTWAIANHSSWKFKYYLALNYWGIDRIEEAKDLLIKCGNEPDFSPFYISRAFLMKGKDEKQVLADLQKAKNINAKEWRNWSKLIEYYEGISDHKMALSLSEEARLLFKDNFYLALQNAKTLLNNKKYDECLTVLSKMVAIPFEHSREGKTIYEQAYLLKTLEGTESKNYDAALLSLEKSKEYPENLGVGKPYVSDIRIQDYLQSLILNKTNQKENARKLEGNIEKFSDKRIKDGAISLNDILYFSILEKNNETSKIKDLVKIINSESLKNKPASRWILANIEKNNKALEQLRNDMKSNKYFEIIEKAVTLSE